VRGVQPFLLFLFLLKYTVPISKGTHFIGQYRTQVRFRLAIYQPTKNPDYQKYFWLCIYFESLQPQTFKTKLI